MGNKTKTQTVQLTAKLIHLPEPAALHEMGGLCLFIEFHVNNKAIRNINPRVTGRKVKINPFSDATQG